MTAGIVRPARASDAQHLAEIYAPYVQKTPISFEMQAPSSAEMLRRVTEVEREYPWLIWEQAGRVFGYAYAHRYALRAAYQWSVEFSIYLDRTARGKGIGTALYRTLADICRKMGCVTAYALITVPNPESIGFHQHLGFECLCVEKSVGYKCGAWRDVAILQKRLRPPPEDPEPLREWRTVVSTGLPVD